MPRSTPREPRSTPRSDRSTPRKAVSSGADGAAGSFREPHPPRPPERVLAPPPLRLRAAGGRRRGRRRDLDGAEHHRAAAGEAADRDVLRVRPVGGRRPVRVRQRDGAPVGQGGAGPRGLRGPAAGAGPGRAVGRGPQVLRPQRRRSTRHLPGGVPGPDGRQPVPAGRVHHHPAVRQERLPVVGADLHPEDEGSRPGGEARAGAGQAGDPHALPQRGLLRARRLRRGGCLEGLLRRRREGPAAAPGRLPGRADPVTGAGGRRPGPGGGHPAAHQRAAGHGGGGVHHPVPGGPGRCRALGVLAHRGGRHAPGRHDPSPCR